MIMMGKSIGQIWVKSACNLLPVTGLTFSCSPQKPCSSVESQDIRLVYCNDLGPSSRAVFNAASSNKGPVYLQEHHKLYT